MEVRATGEFVGWTGLKQEKRIRPFQYSRHRLPTAPEVLGPGLCDRVGHAPVCDYGFDVLNYPEICAAAEAQHHASNHILRKIGMHQGESFTFEGKVCNWYSLRIGETLPPTPGTGTAPA
jgi:ribosomal-protein-alanine N-acetyltransferase